MPCDQLGSTLCSARLNSTLPDSTIGKQSPPTGSAANSEIRSHLRNPAISLKLRPMIELTPIRSTTVRLLINSSTVRSAGISLNAAQ